MFNVNDGVIRTKSRNDSDIMTMTQERQPLVASFYLILLLVALAPFSFFACD